MRRPPRLTALLPRPAGPALRAAVLTLLVVLATLALEWLAWRQYRAVEMREATAAFSRVADQSTLSLNQQLNHYRNALLALRAAYIAADGFSVEEFARYIQILGMDRGLSGLRALAFNRAISDAERDAYLLTVRQRNKGYDPIYAEFDIYPPERRPFYHVAEMVQPPAGNQRSLGYDLLSDDVRQRAIEEAGEHGFAATPPLRLRQDPDALAVLLLTPVPAPSPEGNLRPPNTLGASFVVTDLVETALSPALRRQFNLRLSDLGAAGSAYAQPQPLLDDGFPRVPDLRAVRSELVFGGRRWLLEFHPVQPLTPPIARHELAALFIAGALLAGTVAYLTQQRLQRNSRDHALARLASDCVLRVDASGHVIDADHTALRITGRSARRWRNLPLWASCAPGADAEAIRALVMSVTAEPTSGSAECRVLGDDGKERWISLRLGNHLEHPHLRCLLAQLSSIAKRKAAEAEIERLAFFDPLTGLPNRRLLEERAELTLSAARRQPGHAALMVIDLDGFKTVNDEGGHAAGDKVLEIVAERLQAAIRASDTAARLGGDEFVVLLGAPANEADVRATALRLARAIALPAVVQERGWTVTASIGMALYPLHGTDFASLLGAADAAMYRSKHGAKGLHVMAADPDELTA